MRTSADVVVIGAGVSGCSIAYNLAKRGVRDVVIVEKADVATGASGRCPGGFRHQWSTEADIKLMSASVEALLGLQEELNPPWSLEVSQCGYLFLFDTEGDMEQAKKNADLQQRNGIPVHVLDPQQAGDLAPGLVTDGLVGATFCDWDGRVTPYLMTHAYAYACRRLGVDINTNTEVTGLLTDDSKVTGVVTDKGAIHAPRVICAAAMFSVELSKMIGVEIPITPLRRQMMITERFDRPAWPAILSRYVCYFQTRHGDAIVGTGRPELEEITTRNNRDGLVGAARPLMELAPSFANIRPVRFWAGVYDMSPDAHPIVGPVPGHEGFYLAVGYSGHGFMMGPITGQLMAELVLGTPPSVDPGPLQIDRFERADRVVEKMVY